MDEELYHHGIKGQKWGIRRYQNADGTLTRTGRKRIAQHEKYQTKNSEKINKKWDKKNKNAISERAKANNEIRNRELSKLKKVDIDTFVEAKRVKRGQLFAQAFLGVPGNALYVAKAYSNKDVANAIESYERAGRTTRQEQKDIYRKHGLA